MSPIRSLVTAAALLSASLAAAPTARAQAWNYPSFQIPRVVSRDFNFGLADGGNPGTSLLVQWHEGMSARTQLSLDGGFADPQGVGSDNVVFVGGQFAHVLASESAEMPLDFLLTAGLNAAFVNTFTLVRIPVGVSIGHRFPLEQGMAITPYVHPRLSIDVCGDCAGPDNSKVGISFDVGASFEVNRQIALRASAMFGGSDFLANDSAFGISLAWTPGARSR